MVLTEASVEIWDSFVPTKIRSGTEEDALPVVFLSPMGQKTDVCVWGLESCQFLSRTLLHPMPSPPGAEWRTCEQRARKGETSLSTMQDNPCVKCPFVPELTHPHPCCPPPDTSCQCFTSMSLPVPHSPRELSPWLLCNSWTGSQDLADIPSPPQWHPRGRKVTGVEESASAVLSCLISFAAVLIPMASVCPAAQNSCKAAHIVCVVKRHLTLPIPRPRTFSAEWGCLRAWLQAATGCLHPATAEVNSVLCSQMGIFTKFCVRSRNACAGAPQYCYFNQ